MKKVKMGLAALSVCLLLVSCFDHGETVETEVVTKRVSDKIIAAVQAIGMNSEYVRYEDFYFLDGTKEERLLIEEDIFMTEEELFQMAEDAKADPASRQYRTNNLVTQGKVIKIMGYTGSNTGLGNKAKTALSWAVYNYNKLNLSIRFELSYGTYSADKDMVVYDTSSYNNGSGGGSGFPHSNGSPYRVVQIYGLEGYSTNYNEHVLTHEIGHSIGFRHTDYFSRQSCGQNVNEGDAGVGAVHLSGTPTNHVATSVMVACVPASTNGELDYYDKVGLRVMY